MATLRTAPRATAEIFRVPAILAFVSTVGLVSALVGDGPFDLLSSITLMIPVAVAGRAYARQRAQA